MLHPDTESACLLCTLYLLFYSVYHLQEPSLTFTSISSDCCVSQQPVLFSPLFTFTCSPVRGCARSRLWGWTHLFWSPDRALQLTLLSALGLLPQSPYGFLFSVLSSHLLSPFFFFFPPWNTLINEYVHLAAISCKALVCHRSVVWKRDVSRSLRQKAALSLGLRAQLISRGAALLKEVYFMIFLHVTETFCFSETSESLHQPLACYIVVSNKN